MGLPFLNRNKLQVGLVIGERSLAIATNSGGSPDRPRIRHLEAYFGVGDPDALLKRRVHELKLSGAAAHVCLPASEFQLLPTQFRKAANRDELIEGVRWNLREDFDEPAATLALDVFDGPTTSAGVQTLYAASAGRTRVEHNMAVCRNAGLKAVSCNIAPLALGQVLKPLLDDHSAVIYLLLDRNVGAVTIYRDQKFQFWRRLPEAPEWYLTRMMDELTRDDALLQLAVSMQRAIDEYENHIAELPDDVALCLAPDFPAMDAARAYVNESLSREAVTVDVDAVADILSRQGPVTSSHALMALGAALAAPD